MPARVSAFLVTLMFAFIGLVTAQETTGTIAGRVVDAQGLTVPGVLISVTGPQGTRSFVTDKEGRYGAPFLVPGVYTVRAEFAGFKAAEARNLNVSLGQTKSVNVTMEVGALTETIEVTGAVSFIDSKSTTTGAILDSDMFARVPVGRRITDTLYVAPGVSSGGSVGVANPSFAGGSGLDNLYVIDGVNISNSGYGAIGSYSIVFGSLGNAIPFDFAKEVQVKTGGYEAEFGQSIGGVVNVVTKSGTNQLRGSAFGFTQPAALDATWKTVQTTNGTVNTVDRQASDVGVEGGFPVMEDRLFFFGAINPSWEQRTFIAPDGFPLKSLGEVDRKRRLTSYSAKGTWLLGTPHRVNASFFGDPSHGESGPQRSDALKQQEPTQFSDIVFGGHNQTVRYDGVFGSSWLLEATFARAKNVIKERPEVDEWFVRDRTVVPNVNTGGIGFFEGGNDSENLQYAIKSTNVFAGHQVKYGFLYEDVTFSQIQRQTGPPITAHDGQKTTSGATVDILADPAFDLIYRVTRALFNEERNTRQDYYSFFVQDSWKARDRLTVNAGLRYEQESIVGGFTRLPLLEGGFVDDLSLKHNWAPRIGVVYDVLGGGRSKLFGNYGRFFARVPNDLAAQIFSADFGITRGDYFDAGLTRPVPDGVLAAGVTQHFIAQDAGEAHTFVDPDARLSFKDELVAGFDYEVFTNTNLGIRYIYRTLGRALEDVGLYPHVACDLGSEGACSFDTYVVTNPDKNTPVIKDLPSLIQQPISFEKPVHHYNAIELTMDRRFSDNWSMLSSYRWSRLHGSYEGFFREDNGQSDPALTSLYDFPTNDPTYTSIGGSLFDYPGDVRFLGALGEGPLPLDRPHQLKVFGNYMFSMGLNLGIGLTGTSGKPLTAFASHPNYGNNGEIPITARGEGFQTVDGLKKRTPAEWEFSAQASYRVNLGGVRRVTLLADAFNLFNIRRPIDYNSAVDLLFGGGPNPDFGTVTSNNVSGQMYQAPFCLRLGVRFEF